MPRKKLLLICYTCTSLTPKTVYEHVNAIKKLSQYEIEVFDINHQFTDRKKKYFLKITPKKVRLKKYDGVIIHNTMSYFIENVRKLNKISDIPFEEFQGIKILMKQDEMLRTNETKKLIKDWKINVLLTCVSDKNIELIYPESEFPKLKKLRVETGYVTQEMRNFSFSQSDDRANDIVYRGMKLPFNFGSLSYEKYKIGENFKKICNRFNLRYDISSKLSDRIYNQAWIDFLAGSKAVLAVESGASIFDFTGEVEEKTNKYLNQHPNASFDDVYREILKSYDEKLIYNSVSPRHFEAAATKTVQIMHEGEYGGIFKPGVHYISVKKDYSNIEKVIASFSNRDYRIYLTENAFSDVILNDEYSYHNFVEKFDTMISGCI